MELNGASATSFVVRLYYKLCPSYFFDYGINGVCGNSFIVFFFFFLDLLVLKVVVPRSILKVLWVFFSPVLFTKNVGFLVKSFDVGLS